jgi:hypothetical protein
MLPILGAVALTGFLGWQAWRRLQHWRDQLAVLSELPHPPDTCALSGSLNLCADRDRMHHKLGQLADELGGLAYVRVLWKPVRAPAVAVVAAADVAACRLPCLAAETCC